MSVPLLLSLYIKNVKSHGFLGAKTGSAEKNQKKWLDESLHKINGDTSL